MAEREANISRRAHWAAIGAGLVAIGTLYSNAPEFYGLIAVAAGLMGTYLTRFRLPKHPMVVWPVRVLLFALIITSSYERKARGGIWMLDPSYVNMFGYLCAVELLIQAWLKHGKGAGRGEMLLLSALVMAAGATTYETRYVHLLAPAYAVCVAVSLRQFRTRGMGEERMGRGVGAWPRWVAVGLALCVGFFGAMVLRTYGENVTIYPLSRIFHGMRSAVTGISTSPRLAGVAGPLEPSPVRVLKVEGKWAGGHLRGMSFDTYADGEWGPGLHERKFEAVSIEQLGGGASGRGLKITPLTNDSHNLLYLPLNAVGVRTMAEGGLEREGGYHRVVRARVREEGQASYEAVLGREMHQGPLCAGMSEEERRRCLAVPEAIDVRVRELAVKVAGEGTPQARVAAVVSYLESNHSYSLVTPPAKGEPINDFVLGKQSASCMYFASAAVVMLRCVGVPARFVNGYYAHESAGSGVMVVRQRDAHAWAECWIDGVGWVTVDATPAGGRPDQAYEGVGVWQRIRERIGDWVDAVREWLKGLNWYLVAAYAAGGMACGYAGQWGWRWWRRRRVRPVYAAEYRFPRGELASLAKAFEKVLRRRRAVCPAYRTWSEHVAIKGDAAMDWEAAGEFVEAYQRVRFGGGMGAEALTRLRGMVEKMRKDKRA